MLVIFGMHHPAALLIPHVVGRLGALPVLCEAMVDSAVFIGVYGMPPALGFTGGFILSALSPTVLVTGALPCTGLQPCGSRVAQLHRAGHGCAVGHRVSNPETPE